MSTERMSEPTKRAKIVQNEGIIVIICNNFYHQAYGIFLKRFKFYSLKDFKNVLSCFVSFLFIYLFIFYFSSAFFLMITFALDIFIQ